MCFNYRPKIKGHMACLSSADVPSSLVPQAYFHATNTYRKHYSTWSSQPVCLASSIPEKSFVIKRGPSFLSWVWVEWPNYAGLVKLSGDGVRSWIMVPGTCFTHESFHYTQHWHPTLISFVWVMQFCQYPQQWNILHNTMSDRESDWVRAYCCYHYC